MADFLVYDALSSRQRTNLLLVFHILQLSGAVGLALVLITIAFAKPLKPRHPLAINMMFCWLLYALLSCMLYVRLNTSIHALMFYDSLFSGYSSQLDVPFALCLADAALINAVTLSYVFHALHRASIRAHYSQDRRVLCRASHSPLGHCSIMRASRRKAEGLFELSTSRHYSHRAFNLLERGRRKY